MLLYVLSNLATYVFFIGGRVQFGEEHYGGIEVNKQWCGEVIL